MTPCENDFNNDERGDTAGKVSLRKILPNSESPFPSLHGVHPSYDYGSRREIIHTVARLLSTVQIACHRHSNLLH